MHVAVSDFSQLAMTHNFVEPVAEEVPPEAESPTRRRMSSAVRSRDDAVFLPLSGALSGDCGGYCF